jgi:hypothetical protein
MAIGPWSDCGADNLSGLADSAALLGSSGDGPHTAGEGGGYRDGPDARGVRQGRDCRPGAGCARIRGQGYGHAGLNTACHTRTPRTLTRCARWAPQTHDVPGLKAHTKRRPLAHRQPYLMHERQHSSQAQSQQSKASGSPKRGSKNVLCAHQFLVARDDFLHADLLPSVLKVIPTAGVACCYAFIPELQRVGQVCPPVRIPAMHARITSRPRPSSAQLTCSKHTRDGD